MGEVDVHEAQRLRAVHEGPLGRPQHPGVARGPEALHGVVTEVGSSPIVKQSAGQSEAIKFKVKIQIEDPPEGIKPGLSVQADILTGFRSQALVVPGPGRPRHRAQAGPGAQARRGPGGRGRLPHGSLKPMPIAELLSEALRAIRAHLLRSFLTLLGIIIGVTTLVGVVSVIAGLNSFVQDKVIQLAPDVYVVEKFGIIRSREDFLDALKRRGLDWNDYEIVARTLRLADQVAAEAVGQTAVKFRDRRLADTQVQGTTANFGPLLGLDIETPRDRPGRTTPARGRGAAARRGPRLRAAEVSEPGRCRADTIRWAL